MPPSYLPGGYIFSVAACFPSGVIPSIAISYCWFYDRLSKIRFGRCRPGRLQIRVPVQRRPDIGFFVGDLFGVSYIGL